MYEYLLPLSTFEYRLPVSTYEYLLPLSTYEYLLTLSTYEYLISVPEYLLFYLSVPMNIFYHLLLSMVYCSGTMCTHQLTKCIRTTLDVKECPEDLVFLNDVNQASILG